jgi:putative ABC transport system substrate-binding protein
MRRREFITLLGGAAGTWPLSARAQQTPKVPVIGFLNPGFPNAGVPSYAALQAGLREMGYFDSKTIKIESRWAQGRVERLLALAQELVQLKADILVAVARPAIEAARAATAVLPIIALDLESDPVASGFVTSLAKPGGNLTGLFLDAPMLCGKWLQLINEVVPSLMKIAILWDATTGTYQRDAIKTAAKTMSIHFVIVEFRDASGLDAALNAGLKERPQALVLLGSPIVNQMANRIANITASHRVPGIAPFRSFPKSGGLMSYGPDLDHMFRRVAPYVSKILKGARPTDLPIERPTKFELVVNIKTSKALGLDVPSELLLTADEVIE